MAKPVSFSYLPWRSRSKVPSFPGPAKQCTAFTLVELLAVLTIITILSVLTLPALTSLSMAGNVNQAVNAIPLFLGQCRAYAMAHNTYVWVGFAPDAAGQNVTVGAVAGKTGQANDLASITTYSPITKLQTYKNFALSTNIKGLTGMSASSDDISSSKVGTFVQGGAAGSISFTQIVQFNSQGEATLNLPTGSSHWIQIGLQPVHGTTTNTSNEAAFQLGTLTGQVQIFRP